MPGMQIEPGTHARLKESSKPMGKRQGEDGVLQQGSKKKEILKTRAGRTGRVMETETPSRISLHINKKRKSKVKIDDIASAARETNFKCKGKNIQGMLEKTSGKG